MTFVLKSLNGIYFLIFRDIQIVFRNEVYNVCIQYMYTLPHEGLLPWVAVENLQLRFSKIIAYWQNFRVKPYAPR